MQKLAFHEVFHENPIFHFPNSFGLKQRAWCPNLDFLDFLRFFGFFILGLPRAPFGNPTIDIKSYSEYLIFGFSSKSGV